MHKNPVFIWVQLCITLELFLNFSDSDPQYSYILIHIKIRITYYILCRRNKEWLNPELLTFNILIIAYINYVIRQANSRVPICREVYICMLNIVMNEKFQRIEKKVCMCILQSIYGRFANMLMKEGLKNCYTAMALLP